MTAPGRVLTDLLAAHARSGTRVFKLENGDYVFREKCRCGWTADRAMESQDVHWHAHVALVVEQHMQDHFVIPDGYELWNTVQLERLGEEQERNRKSARETTARWRARTEVSEAAIARLEKELEDWYDNGVVPVKCVRAALEGES